MSDAIKTRDAHASKKSHVVTCYAHIGQKYRISSNIIFPAQVKVFEGPIQSFESWDAGILEPGNFWLKHYMIEYLITIYCN